MPNRAPDTLAPTLKPPLLVFLIDCVASIHSVTVVPSMATAEEARLLLLQAGDLGGGTSAACSGRAQVAEGHLDSLNLRLIREGLARLETLEEELGTTFEWRRNGFLALINAQHLWDDWVTRAQSRLTSARGMH